MVGNSHDKTNFPHRLLLTDAQVSRLCKAFVNHSPARIKLSKPRLLKMVQLEGLLGSLFGPLLKTGLFLIKNTLKTIAKSILIPLELTAAATNAAHQKNVFGSGMSTLVISNKELDDIMKIIKSFKESGLLIKAVSEKCSKRAKRCIFFLLLGMLSASSQKSIDR